MDSKTSIGQEALERVTAAVQQAAGAATGRDDLQREAATERATVATEKGRRLEAASARAKQAAAERELKDTARRAAGLERQAQREQRAARHAEATTPHADGGLVARVVTGGLDIVRLPLTVVERVTGKAGSDWAPAAEFQTLEAGVLKVAGSLLHNDALATRARAKQSAASHASAAVDKRAQSHTIMSEAQAHKAEASEQAQQRTEEADRAAQDRKRAQKRSSAAQATHEVGKRARSDELATAGDEQKAAIQRKRAVRKAANVLDLDTKLEHAKQARKST